MSNSEKVRQWERYLANQKASGLTIQRWCQENNISPHHFYYWKNKLKPPEPPAEVTRASFTELLDKNRSQLFFECNGIRLYLDQACEPQLLKKCLKALREA